MKLHPNAKTTPRSRELLVRRIEDDGWDAASAAESVGVSRRTAYKWLRRWREEGASGLLDRACAPKRIPHRTQAKVVARIERLRRKLLTATAIAGLIGMARSTVSAVLVRLGLNKLSALVPREPVVRYERARPGELIHLDVKKLGGIGKVGHRIHGDRSKRSRGEGWEFVHVCVDDHSRVAYVEILEDERGETAIGFLERAVKWFARLGVRVERTLTDNGSCYISKAFKSRCRELGIKPKYTRAYRPQTNGKAERFIQTMLKEWAYAKPYRSSAWRRRALEPWVQHYNRVRPHSSLSYRPPLSRITSSA